MIKTKNIPKTTDVRKFVLHNNFKKNLKSKSIMYATENAVIYECEEMCSFLRAFIHLNSDNGLDRAETTAFTQFLDDGNLGVFNPAATNIDSQVSIELLPKKLNYLKNINVDPDGAAAHIHQRIINFMESMVVSDEQSSDPTESLYLISQHSVGDTTSISSAELSDSSRGTISTSTERVPDDESPPPLPAPNVSSESATENNSDDLPSIMSFGVYPSNYK